MLIYINETETAIIHILCGIFLFFASLSCFIVFINYKELRQNIYLLIILSTVCEILLSLIIFFNGIFGITKVLYDEKLEINVPYCKTIGSLSLLLTLFWINLNLSIIGLTYFRKTDKTVFSNICIAASLTCALGISMSLYFTDGIGQTFNNTCGIIEFNRFPVFFISLEYLMLGVMSLIFNFWFFMFRDKSKDRSIINWYNWFILLTSFPLIINGVCTVLINYYQIENKAIYIMSIYSVILAYIIIGYYRVQTEYLQIVLKKGPFDYKIINFILLIFCCYKKPEFKQIKRVLNVKLIDCNQSDSTLLDSVIIKSDSLDY